MNAWLLWPNGRAHYFRGSVSLCGSVKMGDKVLMAIEDPKSFYTCSTCKQRAPQMTEVKPQTRMERMKDLTTLSIPGALKVGGLQVGEGWPWDELYFNLAREIVLKEFESKPRDKLTQKQIDIAVAFWARVFEVADPEKREAFEEILREWLTPDYGELRLYVDYDPQGLLLDCVRAIGIECSGCLASADGLFPQKTGTSFDQYTGGVRIQLGRGNKCGTAQEVSDLDRMLEGYRIGPGSNKQ